MNDRSSIGDTVDILFVTPAQMLQLRRVMPQALERSVLVELASRKAMSRCARSPRPRARSLRRGNSSPMPAAPALPSTRPEPAYPA
jgi:hypothetical protein